MKLSEIKEKCDNVSHPDVIQKDFARKCASALKIALEAMSKTASRVISESCTCDSCAMVMDTRKAIGEIEKTFTP